MKGPLKYSIELISENDIDRVIEFLNRSFFLEQPLVDGLGGNNLPDVYFEDYGQKWASTIRQGVSLKAINSVGDVLGVRLNTLLTREHNSERSVKDDKNIEKLNSPAREHFKILDKVYWESNVFKRFPEVDKVFGFSGLAVDPEYRSLGIAKALVERSMLLAEEMGISLIRVTCSNAYSSKAMAKLGFDLVYSLPFSEYLDEEGRPIFTPSAPHTDMQVFVKHLKSE